MDDDARARIQARIDRLCAVDPEAASAGKRFSEYASSSDDLVKLLWQAADEGSATTGLDRALDLAEELLAGSEVQRARHALEIFITHHPAAASLGVRIPPLRERMPHVLLPSKGRSE